MTRMKLTSPGVLLILAVAAACGIFLLDLFFLSPHTESQKRAALREEAVRTEQVIQLLVQAEQNGLRRSAAAWAASGEVRAFFQDPCSQSLDAFLQVAGAPAAVDRVWAVAPDGRQLGSWMAEACPDRDAAPQAAPPPPADPSGPQTDKTDGFLARLRHGPALVARSPVRPAAGGGLLGHLVLAQDLDGDLLERLSLPAGGKLVFVTGDKLPGDVRIDRAAPQTFWLPEQDRMSVAWLERDEAGNSVGYFLATVPVVHIHRQAAGSRRMVLIILSLSVGLALLVILGSHMLITGPVVRLLMRLQRLESGQGSPEDLARNLHGEPLMLARRLENAFERLAQISKTDELTRLANRRHFEEVLEAFYHQARRYSRPMSVIVMDVDFFKAVNDAGGHPAGDEVLKAVAAAVEQACRKADLPARFGGDEFAILLPETAAVDAEAVAERIRKAIAAQKLRAGGLDLSVTVSLGIADMNAGEMDGPGAMVGLADRALYSAKQLGRNRTIQAHDLHVPPVAGEQSESGRIDLLSKKLAGLDNQFKDLFLLAFDQIMSLLEQRDPHMADHTRKVQHYARLIAEEMELSRRVVKRIEIAAMMHDVGMIAMPDAILLCPTQLDEEQTRIMRRHPLLSVRIMERMEFLEQEIPAVRYHHERFDGQGYPEGISGPAIPLTARILAVADAFDAMTSPRTFRDAKSVSEAFGEIRRASGTQFDPAVVNAFMSLADRLGPELIHVPGLEEGQGMATEGHLANGSTWRREGGLPAGAAGQTSADEGAAG